MWTHARKLELMDSILSNSKLAEKDAESIGRKIKRGMARSHGLG